jgi:hypothetical protein
MRWFRARRSVGAGLALFALAVQLVLSFGHIHLEGLHGGALSLAGAQQPVSQSAPANQPTGDTDDYCPICAVIHLASSSFLPDAPQLPLPYVSQTIEYRDNVVVVFVTPRLAAFQARAPPLA